MEAYVAATSVNGLRRGLYHYDSAMHRLELLRKGADACTDHTLFEWPVVVWRAGGRGADDRVFSRTQWKYHAPRAYRAVLIEAGTCARRFALWPHGSASRPFARWRLPIRELNGTSELMESASSVIYAAGVGVRPEKADWAPWPDARTVNACRIWRGDRRVRR